jgi:hypothetical protein
VTHNFVGCPEDLIEWGVGAIGDGLVDLSFIDSEHAHKRAKSDYELFWALVDRPLNPPWTTRPSCDGIGVAAAP